MLHHVVWEDSGIEFPSLTEREISPCVTEQDSLTIAILCCDEFQHMRISLPHVFERNAFADAFTFDNTCISFVLEYEFFLS